MRKIIAKTDWRDSKGESRWEAYEVSEDTKKGKLYYAEFRVKSGSRDCRMEIPMELKPSLLAAVDAWNNDDYIPMREWQDDNIETLAFADVVWKSAAIW